MEIVIRPWGRDDLASIHRITWQSWISTYSSFIPESDLRYYFDIYYTEASLLNMFDNPSMQGFVAEVDDQITGYVRLFYNQDENRLYIPSLYLLPEYQGQDIGRRLLETAERCAVEKSVDLLWIGVMVKNRQALDFYRKVGFLFKREEPFTMGKTTVSHLIGYKKVGRNSFLEQKTYAIFDKELKSCLPKLCLELLSDQKKEWMDLREGYELFKHVREREISCSGFYVHIQFNTGRIKSSTANVDKKNAEERGCFLCLDHLPWGQKGILYRGDYLILCNPMPVFPSHFTITHLDHRLQAITEHIDTLLQLMADFGSGWTVLYNGPKCGASAPDHFHFQAAPSGPMPIEKEIQEEKKFILMKQTNSVLIYRARDLGREAILLEGDDWMAVANAFKSFLDALRKVLLVDEEPMVNIAAYYKERKWRLVIFPRRKHRPEAFFKEGDNRIVVSPGVIDMGGLLITPVAKDFERLDAVTVESIYREVSLEGKTVERALESMK